MSHPTRPRFSTAFFRCKRCGQPLLYQQTCRTVCARCRRGDRLNS